MTKVSDLRITSNVPLLTPGALMAEIPRTEQHAATVTKARAAITSSLHGEDSRFILIIGPCSIHNLDAGRDYAERLAKLADEVKEKVLVVMRVYFEKPRTSVGWKGLIMDPHLDGTNDIPEGLRQARRFLRTVLDLGVPTATEMLDPITPQYIADLTCWAAIGARTTESQTHRQMASGLSMPVGFKNTTSGDVVPAINAIKAAMQPQTFLGISDQGQASVVTTTGNAATHVILRGGEHSPNHDPASVGAALAALGKAGLSPSLIIDASHANCYKKHTLMGQTYREILAQRAAGNRGIVGAMVESFIAPGNQALGDDKDALTYGESITDPCIGWEETVELIRETAAKL